MVAALLAEKDTPELRIAIYGAGGLGAYYGARMHAAGHDVCFVARGAHLAAMQSNGLVVNSVEQDLSIDAPEATDDPAECGPVDLVVVAVKTWQIPEIAPTMAPLLHADSVVLPLLNGVEAADELAATLGPAPLVGGLSRVFSYIEAPGVIRHFKPGAPLEFGELNGGDSARCERLAEAFRAAGIDAKVDADIRSALWRKLLMVSSWAGVGALTRSPIGVVREHTGTRALVAACMAEGIAVGRARGHVIDDSFTDFLWAFYAGTPADATASMQRDVLAGRASELHAWNGAVVRSGRETGVATPTHAMILDLLDVMEQRARGTIKTPAAG